MYVAEIHGGQIADSETASFVFSQNPYESDTKRSVCLIVPSFLHSF